MSRANSSVMLTLIPSAVSARTAGTPATVPGTLIIRLRRPTSFHRWRASAIVACVSLATPGETSMLT